MHPQKATLIPGGSESLVYTTLSGTVGVLVPFTSREDHELFQNLEMHMRSEHPPLCGRDHLSFRSYFFPVKVSTSIEGGGGFSCDKGSMLNVFFAELLTVKSVKGFI